MKSPEMQVASSLEAECLFSHPYIEMQNKYSVEEEKAFLQFHFYWP